ncbi:hypothetical protein [Providencia stuartii]|uniref:hypothetical protein n=1 Tax=Providencia stuartii TaxID=588 RepID=UPI00112414F8|nr:hypothetical protein [Providencia stuartii]
MKKALMVGVVVALLAGCDSKQDAPFGLKWGQSFNSVKSQLGENAECIEKASDYKYCSFYSRQGQVPFNDWIESGWLSFDDDGLSELEYDFSAHNPDVNEFYNKQAILFDKLKNEMLFQKGQMIDEKRFNEFINKCESVDTCENIEESFITNVGLLTVTAKSESPSFTPTTNFKYKPLPTN